MEIMAAKLVQMAGDIELPVFSTSQVQINGVLAPPKIAPTLKLMAMPV